MQIAIDQIHSFVGTFMWPFCRISGMIMVMPITGSKVVNSKVRVGLSLFITIIILPALPAMPTVEVGSLHGFIIIAQQLLLGILIGFIMKLVFEAFVIGGQIIAMQAGLGFASLVDPQSGVTVPLVSQLYLMLITLTFMAFNGHLLIIELLTQSFYTMPVSTNGLTPGSLHEMLQWSREMFSGAVLMAMPAIVALLVVNMSFGIMARAAPQFNIFAVGFPLTLTLGVIIVYVSFSNILPKLDQLINSGFDLMRAIVAG